MNDEWTARPTWAEIDLSALLHNLKQAQKFCSAQQRILAVVKADAYGHGAVAVSRRLKSSGVRDFAVATLAEAVELRQAGLDDFLLVLGGCFPGQEEAFIDYRLTPALFDHDTAVRLNSVAVRRKQTISVHLKVDTGMGRVGFQPDQLRNFLPQLKELKGLLVEGFMSHLACADELSSNVTIEQQRCFAALLTLLREHGIEPRDIHLNNSAGLSAGAGGEWTLARPGIMLYGGLPGPEFSPWLELKPVMHLRSCIAQLRFLPAGRGISYGHSFYAPEALKVAVLPIGYADGFSRLHSNHAYGILRGQFVPLIGRVCMDWIMFDVSTVVDAQVGDPVTLLGTADGLSILGDDWAKQLGTISYEVFCLIGQRIPRRYLA